jgi:signal transduction histidine kinase
LIRCGRIYPSGTFPSCPDRIEIQSLEKFGSNLAVSTESCKNTVRYWKGVTRYFAIITCLSGLLGIVGWVFNLPVLYSFLSSGASMKFNSAVLALLSGASILCLRERRVQLCRILSLIVFITSVLTLWEHIFRVDFHIDELLMPDMTRLSAREPSGRMSFISAIGYILISSAILFTSFRKFYAGQIFAVITLFLIYSQILGWLFNIGSLLSFGRYSATAMPTAIAVLFASLAVLSHTHEKGWLREFSGQNTASKTARYAIFYFFMSTPLFVGLFLLTTRHSTFPPKFHIVVLIMATMAFTLPFAFVLLRKLNRADAKLEKMRRQASLDAKMLNRKNQELQRINQYLDNVIHIISHDLRTPIMSLQGSLAIIEKSFSGDDEKERRILAIPSRAVKRLKDTVESIGDILRNQRPGQHRFEEIDICGMVEEIQAELKPQFEQTGARIITRINPCKFVYERLHINSILYNLIQNALKYHAPEREPLIRITLETVDEAILLEVQDNGLGMEPEQVSELFTRYKRFHDHVEGTGVGLYLTRQLVEARGGKIEVSSRSGEGTTFRIFFPVYLPDMIAATDTARLG